MPLPSPQSLIDACVSLLERERVLDGEAVKAYAVDGRTPLAVVRPSTAEELASVLAEASRLGAAVIPWGGGTGMALGNPPLAYNLAIETRALDRVIEYEPADLTITVEAGITLARLQEVLAQHGQFFPVDPPGWESATLGGVLASGATGPSLHAYGPARDWVLGLRVAHADGRISRGGGRVVKNVAGYDMARLYLGSLGTLGVIVEASLKVTPLAPAEATWLGPLTAQMSIDEAVALVLEAHGKNLRLRALALVRTIGSSTAAEGVRPSVLPGGFGASEDETSEALSMAAWVSGSERAVERSLRELDDLAAAARVEPLRLDAARGGSLWEAVRASCRPSSDGQAVARGSFLPSQAAAILREMEAIKPMSVVAYPAAGVAYGRFVGATLWAQSVARLRQAATPESGGSVVVEACPQQLKERVDVFGEPRQDFPLMRRLKEQMDPGGVLNRGRFLGRL